MNETTNSIGKILSQRKEIVRKALASMNQDDIDKAQELFRQAEEMMTQADNTGNLSTDQAYGLMSS